VREVASGLEIVAFIDDQVITCPLPCGGVLTLGRDADNAIRLDHPSVSRRHATLHVGPPLQIEDLGSANGTRVRSRRSHDDHGGTHRLWSATNQPIEIAPGDGLVFGSVAAVVRPVGPRPVPAIDTSAQVDGDEALVVVAPAMQALYRQAERAARSPISVLLLGETGVGKEVLARFIHRRSPRAAGPFIALNCAALSESLLEGELFGHEKGSFTGAVQARPGLFEAAHQGTLFLDEIGELPLSFQVKLLRVLEERAVLRIGARTPRPVDLRILAATHRDLDVEVAKGAFRQDLFFRLAAFTITVSPLRERVAEIGPLAQAFLTQIAARYEHPELRTIDPAVLAALERHAWPGNLRELRNVIERAVVLCDGPSLLPEHLPAKLVGGAAAQEQCLVDAQAHDRQRIQDALALCAGNQSRAAKMLGISRRTLVTRLDAFDIARPRKR
jgi:two-component system response regulator AtoC